MAKKSNLEPTEKRELAQLLLEFESVSCMLEDLEYSIAELIVKNEESVEVGNVRATFYNPSDVYDYVAPGSQADPETIKACTTIKTTETIAWKKVCDLAGLEPSFVTTKPARATVKVL